jgi:hypothetical protein
MQVSFDDRRQEVQAQRKRFWRELLAEGGVAGRRALQAAVSDWLFDLANEVRFNATHISGRPGAEGLWSRVDLAGDVVGLEEAYEVFQKRRVALFPAAFLERVGRALNNASVILYDLCPRRPLIDDPTKTETASGGVA